MTSQFVSMTSEEIIQIKFFCGVYYLTVLAYTNYSPQCRWLVVLVVNSC